MPGFRPGKAPRRLLEARLGTEIARDQALRDSLPEYYAEAVVAEDVDVIAPPEIDITAGEEEGDVEFDAVVEVRPVVTVEGHDALRIEIERARRRRRSHRRARSTRSRERFADLEDSRGAAHRRRLRRDRHQGLRRRRVGRGPHRHRLPLRGRVGDRRAEARRGAARQAPRRHPQVRRRRCPSASASAPATRSSFQVLVKEAKKKVLPELTDEWVTEVSEFETVEALQDDVRTRLDVYARVQALDGDAGEGLRGRRRARARRGARHARRTARWSAASTTSPTGSRSRGSSMTIPQYLAATGQDQQEFVDNVRVGADRGRARRPRAARR